MKSTIVNILVLILMFNLIMIIFPEGKTQKFCRISLKLFIMIYILDNIFLNGSINLNLLDMPDISPDYQREMSIQNIDPEFIEKLNQDFYEGEEVIKNIELNFTGNMDIDVLVTTKGLMSTDTTKKIKKEHS
ncbi:hypothetical protein [Sedimentibacter sp. B4]|uniref:hypothetical protein n=1 Tax=Sedimentibacter sp. B4 TaxID=304766 RepID=UPI0002E196C4|nr:hypothetical protein [Sedimentibacter sp. B4]